MSITLHYMLWVSAPLFYASLVLWNTLIAQKWYIVSYIPCNAYIMQNVIKQWTNEYSYY